MASRTLALSERAVVIQIFARRDEMIPLACSRSRISLRACWPSISGIMMSRQIRS